MSLTCLAALAQSGGARPKRLVSSKAAPPKWTAAERGAFFENAAEQLGPEPVASMTSPSSSGTSDSTSETPSAGGFAWSKLIAADNVESEVKSLAKLLDAAVKSPNEFKGGGFKTSRREFTSLAAMFGIIAEYDGDVRWQKQGAALRDAFGRAGKNSKVGTDATYAEAKRRAEELAELIRGTNAPVEAGTAENNWSETADRAPLMERLEIARAERLKPWTGAKNDFTAHREEIIHEASLVAALAEVIKHPGYDFAEDESYLQYVTNLQTAAIEATAAAQQNDFPAAQAAISALGQSCDQCHGDYR
ncbi:MAG: cytochrome c [Planctomycetia bacterium]|nr:cytochrome c [Planctomycetia bacterium]